MSLIKLLLGVIGFFMFVVLCYFFANLDTFLPDDMETIRNNPKSEEAKICKRAIAFTGIFWTLICLVLIV